MTEAKLFFILAVIYLFIYLGISLIKRQAYSHKIGFLDDLLMFSVVLFFIRLPMKEVIHFTCIFSVYLCINFEWISQFSYVVLLLIGILSYNGSQWLILVNLFSIIYILNFDLVFSQCTFVLCFRETREEFSAHATPAFI